MSKIEKLVERKVTNTLEMGGKLHVVENVPARVDEETGEQFFSPTTVERLRETLREKSPDKVVQTPVYEYSE